MVLCRLHIIQQFLTWSWVRSLQRIEILMSNVTQHCPLHQPTPTDIPVIFQTRQFSWSGDLSWRMFGRIRYFQSVHPDIHHWIHRDKIFSFHGHGHWQPFQCQVERESSFSNLIYWKLKPFAVTKSSAESAAFSFEFWWVFIFYIILFLFIFSFLASIKYWWD